MAEEPALEHGGLLDGELPGVDPRFGVRGRRRGDRRLAGRLELEIANETRADGTSHHPAHQDAAHRGGEAQDGGAFDARLLEGVREREGRPGAARERNRSRQDAEERRKPEGLGDADAEEVLEHEHDRARGQVERHEPPAFAQGLERGAVAHGREEGDHKGRLEDLVKVDRGRVALAQPPHRERHDKTAHDRRRQVVAFGPADPSNEKLTEDERQRGRGKGFDGSKRKHPIIVTQKARRRDQASDGDPTAAYTLSSV